MDYAVEHGITLFDTAEAYGAGQARDYRKNSLQVSDIREVSGEHHSSEKIIGRWLRATGARDLIRLVSKVTTDFTRRHLREALAASLDRVGASELDIYMFHRYDAGTPLDEALSAMDDARASGSIRVVGCSNFTGLQLREALAICRRLGLTRPEVTQSACSLAARDSETDLLPLCREEELAFLGYSPLGAGFLSGKYNGDRTAIPAGSRFHVIPAHADIYFNTRNFQTVEALHRAAVKLGIPPMRLAIAWVLAHPAVTTVLCGARNIGHLDNALAAARLDEPVDWPPDLRPC
jgi:aryl-alcohol dehydrogenase-like predicted oxidoreductase